MSAQHTCNAWCQDDLHVCVTYEFLEEAGLGWTEALATCPQNLLGPDAFIYGKPADITHLEPAKEAPPYDPDGEHHHTGYRGETKAWLVTWRWID